MKTYVPNYHQKFKAKFEGKTIIDLSFKIRVK